MDEVGSEWSNEQNKLFENALANYPEDALDRWEKIAADVPGKTLEQIKHYYELLVDDIHNIESGFVPLLDYDSFSKSTNSTKRAIVKKGTKVSRSYHWTEDEHRFVIITWLWCNLLVIIEKVLILIMYKELLYLELSCTLYIK